MSVDITEPALDETDPGFQTRNGTPIPEWHLLTGDPGTPAIASVPVRI
jgi:hypothetical protein